jgi:hypothetical protein
MWTEYILERGNNCWQYLESLGLEKISLVNCYWFYLIHFNDAEWSLNEPKKLHFNVALVSNWSITLNEQLWNLEGQLINNLIHFNVALFSFSHLFSFMILKDFISRRSLSGNRNNQLHWLLSTLLWSIMTFSSKL